MIFFRNAFNLSALSTCQHSAVCRKASKNQLLCGCSYSVLPASVSFLFSLTCTLIAASQAKLQEPADSILEVTLSRPANAAIRLHPLSNILCIWPNCKSSSEMRTWKIKYESRGNRSWNHTYTDGCSFRAMEKSTGVIEGADEVQKAGGVRWRTGTSLTGSMVWGEFPLLEYRASIVFRNSIAAPVRFFTQHNWNHWAFSTKKKQYVL